MEVDGDTGSILPAANVTFVRLFKKPGRTRFVGMYVNHWTIDYGDAGQRAVRELLRRGHEAGLVPPTVEIDFLG